MNSMDGGRPYACDVCGARFFRSSTMKAHKKRHAGARQDRAPDEAAPETPRQVLFTTSNTLDRLGTPLVLSRTTRTDPLSKRRMRRRLATMVAAYRSRHAIWPPDLPRLTAEFSSRCPLHSRSPSTSSLYIWVSPRQP